LRDVISAPERDALGREILRCAQDDTKNQDDTKTRGASRVILSESCCSEESRRTPGVGLGYEEGLGRMRNLSRPRDARE
jgi:hypothetical protein